MYSHQYILSKKLFCLLKNMQQLSGQFFFRNIGNNFTFKWILSNLYNSITNISELYRKVSKWKIIMDLVNCWTRDDWDYLGTLWIFSSKIYLVKKIFQMWHLSSQFPASPPLSLLLLLLCWSSLMWKLLKSWNPHTIHLEYTNIQKTNLQNLSRMQMNESIKHKEFQTLF